VTATAAQKTTQSTIPAPANDYHEEITIERRVKVQAPAADQATRKTARLTKVDSRLLAIARGDLELDDPFGGLIPIYDNDDEALQVDDAWLMLAHEPEPAFADEGLFGDTVPSVRMRAFEIMALPLEPRSAFFLTQVDGKRTVGELVRICKVDDLAGLEIIDELLRFGAIELR
jgi:hypothetical protein